ncbi:MAG: 5'-methylthioadenosine/adenosylhomocysteine nucleosidase [Paenibacillaceae bacterium]
MSYRKIGIIGAMTEEVEHLQEKMTVTQTFRHAGIPFTEGNFGSKSIVVCKSGVGKVNAAMCTQALIDFFKVDAVVFTGVAGALDPDLNIGDIVISTDCMQHDMDVTALGFARGIIPYQETSVFVADSILSELAYQASMKLYPKQTKKGRILSGDQFIADRDKVHALFDELFGACTEMEGAAAAQVCVTNEIAFVIIRSMSDKANGVAPEHFAEFMKQAALHSYQIVEEMLTQLP